MWSQCLASDARSATLFSELTFGAITTASPLHCGLLRVQWSRPLPIHLVTHRIFIIALVLTGCSAPTTALSPAAEGARAFRPISELFFLPEKAAAEKHTQEGAALVPDSKIEWDLRVTVQNLGLGGVEVHVKNQAVALSGVVPSEEARATLLQAAQRTRGVKSVSQSVDVVP